MTKNVSETQQSQNVQLHQASQCGGNAKKIVITVVALVALGCVVVGILTVKGHVLLNFRLGVGLIGAGGMAVLVSGVWFICPKVAPLDLKTDVKKETQIDQPNSNPVVESGFEKMETVTEKGPSNKIVYLDKQAEERVDGKRLISYTSGSQQQPETIEVWDTPSGLIVYEGNNKSAIPIEAALLKIACQAKTENIPNVCIAPMLEHPSFSDKLRRFIQITMKGNCSYALPTDILIDSEGESGIPFLFKFSDQAILDVIKIGAKFKGLIDPLKIVDTFTNRNLFQELAHCKNERLLFRLSKLFPIQYSTYESSLRWWD